MARSRGEIQRDEYGQEVAPGSPDAVVKTNSVKTQESVDSSNWKEAARDPNFSHIRVEAAPAPKPAPAEVAPEPTPTPPEVQVTNIEATAQVEETKTPPIEPEILPPINSARVKADQSRRVLPDIDAQFIVEPSNPSASETPPQSETIPADPQEKLNYLRKRYIKSKGTAAETIARLEYKIARDEVVAGNVEKTLEEQDRLVFAQMEGVKMEKSTLDRLQETYAQLGKIRVPGKAGVVLNARTAINASLLGISLVSGAGSAIGIGAIVGRRIMSGVGMSSASYDIMKAVRNRSISKEIDTAADKSKDPEELAEIMLRIQTRAALDGKSLEDLNRDDAFVRIRSRQKLVLETMAAKPEDLKVDNQLKKRLAEAQEKQIKMESDAIAAGKQGELFDNPEYKNLKAEVGALRQKIVDTYLSQSIPQSDSKLQSTISDEKSKRRLMKLGAAGLGAVIGSGAWSKVFGGNYLWEQPGTGPKVDTTELPKPPASPGPEPLPTTAPPPFEGPIQDGFVAGDPISPELKDQIDLANEQQSALDAAGITKDTENMWAEQQSALDAAKPDSVLKAEAAAAAAKEAAAEASGEPLAIKATAKGLEGDLLNLKSADPDRYEKMISWLQSRPYNKGVANPGALVHRFMEDYAKTHDMTIDTGGPKDLSRIVSGEMHVNADGSIALDKEGIKFMAEKAAKATETVATFETVKPEDLGPGKFEPKFVNPLNKDIPGPFKVEMPFSTASAEAADSASDSPLSEEFIDKLAAKNQEFEAAMRHQELSAAEIARVRAEAANVIEKPSLAVSIIMDSKAKSFLKDTFQLTPGSFDKIGNKSISEFLAEYKKGNPIFVSKYQGVYEAMSDSLKKTGSDEKVRQLVLAVAKALKK